MVDIFVSGVAVDTSVEQRDTQWTPQVCNIVW